MYEIKVRIMETKMARDVTDWPACTKCTSAGHVGSMKLEAEKTIKKKGKRKKERKKKSSTPIRIGNVNY